jgi:ferredoxin
MGRRGVSLERCPACRGRLTPEPSCPRCGCDLALVRRAEAQAQQRLALALHAYARGDLPQARLLAQAAQTLSRSLLTVQLLRLLG